MTVKKIWWAAFVKTAALTLIAGTGLTLAADNNIVTTLQITYADNQSSFTLAKAGWVRIEGDLADEVVFDAPGSSDVSVKSRSGSATAFLPAATYSVKGKVTSARRIGANMYCSMDGKFNTDVPAVIPDNAKMSGRAGMFLYNWNYLDKNILDPFPVLLLNNVHAPEIKNWRAQGRKVIRRTTILPQADKTLELWNRVASEPEIDGIIPDEFVIPAGRKSAADASLGYSNPGVGFGKDNLQNVVDWGKAHPAMRFWAWLGIPWNALSSDVEPLIKALRVNGGYIAWESYAFGRNWQRELKTRYLNRAAGFKELTGGMENFVVCPGTFEYIDNNWELDFKVYLDMQLHAVATHPDFKGTAGIGMWIAYYTNPEILRWYSALVKHYAVDGEREMLSKKYGFELKPAFVKSPNWENLTPWQIAGDAKLVPVAESQLKISPYMPKTTANLLQLTSDGKQTTSASQQINGLTPQKVYTLEVMAVDPQNDGSEVVYPFTAEVKNAEVLDRSVRQLTNFSYKKKPVYNVYKIRFKASDSSAQIVLQLTGKAKLLVDAVRITPYFE